MGYFSLLDFSVIVIVSIPQLLVSRNFLENCLIDETRSLLQHSQSPPQDKACILRQGVSCLELLSRCKLAHQDSKKWKVWSQGVVLIHSAQVH